jgi:hypothetical protein
VSFLNLARMKVAKQRFQPIASSWARAYEGVRQKFNSEQLSNELLRLNFKPRILGRVDRWKRPAPIHFSKNLLDKLEHVLNSSY